MEKDPNDPRRPPAWTWDNFISFGSDPRAPHWRRLCRSVQQQEGDEHIQPLLPGNHALLDDANQFNMHAFYAFQNQAQAHGQPPPHGHAMSPAQMTKLTYRLQNQAALMQARNLSRRAVQQLMFICSKEPGNEDAQHQLSAEQQELQKLQGMVEESQAGIVQWLTHGVADDHPVQGPIAPAQFPSAIDRMLFAFNRGIEARLGAWDRQTRIRGFAGLWMMIIGVQSLNLAHTLDSEAAQPLEPEATLGWLLVGLSIVTLLYTVLTAQRRQ